jgi:SAM-dependent methyltransferase
MIRPLSSTNWEVIDRTADPGAFADYLDAVSSLAGAQAYKQWSYDLLNIRPGDRVIDVGCGTGDDARAVLAEIADEVRNPHMGRQLYALFGRSGLTAVQVVPFNGVFTDFAQADALVHLQAGLDRAIAKNAVEADAAARWIRDLREASAAGRFFAALTGFVVAGGRPWATPGAGDE